MVYGQFKIMFDQECLEGIHSLQFGMINGSDLFQ